MKIELELIVPDVKDHCLFMPGGVVKITIEDDIEWEGISNDDERANDWKERIEKSFAIGEVEPVIPEEQMQVRIIRR